MGKRKPPPILWKNSISRAIRGISGSRRRRSSSDLGTVRSSIGRDQVDPMWTVETLQIRRSLRLSWLRPFAPPKAVLHRTSPRFHGLLVTDVPWKRLISVPMPSMETEAAGDRRFPMTGRRACTLLPLPVQATRLRTDRDNLPHCRSPEGNRSPATPWPPASARARLYAAMLCKQP